VPTLVKMVDRCLFKPTLSLFISSPFSLLYQYDYNLLLIRNNWGLL
jgi:hypothetical protein